MASTSVDWQSVREKLAARRRDLFERLLENPGNIKLAAEIRRLDDELQVCADHIQRDRQRAAKDG